MLNIAYKHAELKDFICQICRYKTERSWNRTDRGFR